jgi:ABC-type oligopeptide transport system substrate-binding subunit
MHEARRLMAEAGSAKGLKGMDFLVREASALKLRAAAIQVMLKEALNIETNLGTGQISAWFDDAQAGNFDLTTSAMVSTLMDPSDYFHGWYSEDGPQNYARWHNEAFQHLLPQIDREGDDTRRKALVRRPSRTGPGAAASLVAEGYRRLVHLRQRPKPRELLRHL